MKILFLQQQRIKPKSPCPNFDLPYPHFQDSAFYSAHWTPRIARSHTEPANRALAVCRIARSHTEPANRALAVCAELPDRTPNRRTVHLRCAELPDRTPGRRRKACSFPTLHSGLDSESRLAETGS